MTRVAGRLPAARRDRLVASADRVVTGYLDGVLGRGDPFADFTRGARALATDSVPEVSERLQARRGTAYLAVLAPEGRLLGATARFQVPLRAGEDAGRRAPVTRLTGRLLLTPTRSGWRVFGYDVTWPDGARTRLGGGR